MDTNNQPIELLRHAIACLNDTDLSLLDFDTLRDRLATLVNELEHADRMSTDHALLRADYEQRLAGMIKAIAAVDRKRGGVEDALATVDRLTHLTASELIAEYRRVSAAFRDSFPTTFHSRHTGSPSASRGERRHPEPVEGSSRANETG